VRRRAYAPGRRDEPRGSRRQHPASEGDRDLAANAPLIAVFVTTSDTLRDRLAAGRALARVFLRACASGMYASFLMQPIEVAGLRTRLQEAVGMAGCPQVMLRMGYGSQVRPTPRRPLEDVHVP